MKSLTWGRAALAVSFGFVFGFSNCSSLQFDRGVSAADGHEPTTGLSGCGQSPHTYLFCQLKDKSAQTDIITLKVPPAACARSECVKYQVIDKSGNFTIGGGIPRGQSETQMTIAQITGVVGPVNPSIDAEYRINVRVYFTGPDGKEYSSDAFGLIRINVLTSDYQPIGCNDPAVVWEANYDKAGKCRQQWTTAMRSAICGTCEIGK